MPYEADLLILGASEVITAGLERLEAIDDGALALKDGRILRWSGTLSAALPWVAVATAAAGKRADLVLWTEPDHRRVINRFGYNMVDQVLIAGRTMVHDGRLVEPRPKHAIA